MAKSRKKRTIPTVSPQSAFNSILGSKTSDPNNGGDEAPEIPPVEQNKPKETDTEKALNEVKDNPDVSSQQSGDKKVETLESSNDKKTETEQKEKQKPEASRSDSSEGEQSTDKSDKEGTGSIRQQGKISGRTLGRKRKTLTLEDLKKDNSDVLLGVTKHQLIDANVHMTLLEFSRQFGIPTQRIANNLLLLVLTDYKEDISAMIKSMDEGNKVEPKSLF